MEDKRRFPRFAVDAVQGKMGLRSQVQLLDLSLGGAAIRVKRKLSVGAEYALKFDLGKGFITIKAIVLWSVMSPNESGEGVPEYSAGLQFTDVLTGKLQALFNYIDEHKVGEERRQSDEQKAESLIASGLAKVGWTEEDLGQRRKTDPIKLRLAAKLRRETPLTLKWIAARLQTGTWKNLNRRLYEYRELPQK